MKSKGKYITWDELVAQLEAEANRPRTWKDTLEDVYYFFWRTYRSIRRFIRNLPYDIYRVFYWLPTIWKDHWNDKSYLLIMLEHKLRYDGMRYIKDEYTISENSRDRGDKMLRCAELCKRIREDEHYFIMKEAMETAGIDTEENYKELHIKSNEMLKKDVDELFNTLRDNILDWWD